MFFVLFTHPSFLFYFDKHRHWQIKYGRFAASSAQRSANRLVKAAEVRATVREYRQALDLRRVFSLRFISREPASERTSFYRYSDFISDSMRSLRTVSLQR